VQGSSWSSHLGGCFFVKSLFHPSFATIGSCTSEPVGERGLLLSSVSSEAGGLGLSLNGDEMEGVLLGREVIAIGDDWYNKGRTPS
jgi:hypothetical protein